MEKYYRRPFIEHGGIRALIFFITWLGVIFLFQLLGYLVLEKLNLNDNSVQSRLISWSALLLVSLGLIAFFRRNVDRRPFINIGLHLGKRRFDLFIGLLI